MHLISVTELCCFSPYTRVGQAGTDLSQGYVTLRQDDDKYVKITSVLSVLPVISNAAFEYQYGMAGTDPKYYITFIYVLFCMRCDVHNLIYSPCFLDGIYDKPYFWRFCGCVYLGI